MNTAMILATALMISGTLVPPIEAAESTKAFTVVERATTDRLSVRGGSEIDNPGDILTFANEVFDADNLKKVGTINGYCVRLVVGKAWECHWTLFLAEGQIAVAGPFLDDRDSTLAITGGTGAYATARGEMLLHARDAKGTAFNFTYKIR